ncbi:hypothetical protein HKK71_28585, partial [Bacillus paranthracis]|nr:hypothetical protein [Bacillus paranthracis]
MNIKEVSKAVQAIRLAGNEDGIISIRGNEVHLNRLSHRVLAVDRKVAIRIH